MVHMYERYQPASATTPTTPVSDDKPALSDEDAMKLLQSINEHTPLLDPRQPTQDSHLPPPSETDGSNYDVAPPSQAAAMQQPMLSEEEYLANLNMFREAPSSGPVQHDFVGIAWNVLDDDARAKQLKGLNIPQEALPVLTPAHDQYFEELVQDAVTKGIEPMTGTTHDPSYTASNSANDHGTLAGLQDPLAQGAASESLFDDYDLDLDKDLFGAFPAVDDNNVETTAVGDGNITITDQGAVDHGNIHENDIFRGIEDAAAVPTAIETNTSFNDQYLVPHPEGNANTGLTPGESVDTAVVIDSDDEDVDHDVFNSNYSSVGSAYGPNNRARGVANRWVPRPAYPNGHSNFVAPPQRVEGGLEQQRRLGSPIESAEVQQSAGLTPKQNVVRKKRQNASTLAGQKRHLGEEPEAADAPLQKRRRVSKIPVVPSRRGIQPPPSATMAPQYDFPPSMMPAPSIPQVQAPDMPTRTAANGPQPRRRAQAGQLARNRTDAFNWVPPQNDKSIPHNNATRLPYVRRLFGSIVDFSNCIEVIDAQACLQEWSSQATCGPNTLSNQMEAVCWNIVLIAQTLHTKGPHALSILDSEKLKAVYKTRKLTFAARMDRVCNLLRYSKARCETALEFEDLEVLVGTPGQLTSHTQTNKKLNSARQGDLGVGRDVVQDKNARMLVQQPARPRAQGQVLQQHNAGGSISQNMYPAATRQGYAPGSAMGAVRPVQNSPQATRSVRPLPRTRTFAAAQNFSEGRGPTMAPRGPPMMSRDGKRFALDDAFSDDETWTPGVKRRKQT